MELDRGMRLRDARAAYFSSHGLGPDGGYDASHVVFPVGPWRLSLPNVAARRRALPLHDLNHLATGYETSWTGESEIAAWELASGCGMYPAVWFLSIVAFSVGLIIAPRRLWRAFTRGRRSSSLYHEKWNDRWLDLTVGELRDRLNLTGSVAVGNHVLDLVLFAACALPLLLALAGVLRLALVFF